MSAVHPGIFLIKSVANAASLGFVPVAIHFDLFAILVRIGKPATVEEVTKVCNDQIREKSNDEPELCVPLAADTLLIMAGLGLVSQDDEGIFSPNDITKYMIDMPSAQHGAFHFTTDVLFGAAFLWPMLQDTKFQYPLKEADGPIQYAYKRMGDKKLADMHTYSIIEHEGRMDSFNKFMAGKFVKFGKMPGRVKEVGYDLDAAIYGSDGDESVVMVDIGGGRGELLQEVREAYPDLKPGSLVVEEFNSEIDSIPGITLIEWNFKEDSPQPVQGARIYCLQHVLHNLSDLEAIKLLQNIVKAMASHSRLVIIEFTKNKNNASCHSTMIALYSGRERSSAEWKQIASICGLDVTFESYPDRGECLVEMRKPQA